MLNMQDLPSLPSKLFCSYTSNPKYQQTHRQWLANLGNTHSSSNYRESTFPFCSGKNAPLASRLQTTAHGPTAAAAAARLSQAKSPKSLPTTFQDVPRSSVPQPWLAWVKNPQACFVYFLIHISYLWWLKNLKK